jgi:hypothetical protein
MKKFMAVLGLVFAVSLGVAVGLRMNSEAMAVIIGVICGVAASVPTSLLIIYTLGKRGESQANQRSAASYPPVVVVNPSAPQQGSNNPWQRQNYPLLEDQPRQFRVIGEEETSYNGEDFL